MDHWRNEHVPSTMLLHGNVIMPDYPSEILRMVTYRPSLVSRRGDDEARRSSIHRTEYSSSPTHYPQSRLRSSSNPSSDIAILPPPTPPTCNFFVCPHVKISLMHKSPPLSPPHAMQRPLCNDLPHRVRSERSSSLSVAPKSLQLVQLVLVKLGVG